MLNINHLAYFVKAVECGSISAAASELGVSPQAVSRALKDFEGYVGVPLLQRDGRRSVPTEFGAKLYSAADELSTYINDVEQVIASRKNGPSPFVEGCVTVAMPDFLLESGWFSRRSLIGGRQASGVALSYRVANNDNCMPLVADDYADIGIVLGDVPSSDCEKRWLLSVPIDPIASTNHPLASKKSIDWPDVCAYEIANPIDSPICTRIISLRLERRGFRTRFFTIGSWPGGNSAFLSERFGIILAPKSKALDEKIRDSKNLVSLGGKMATPMELPLYCVHKADKSEAVTYVLGGIADEAKAIRLALKQRASRHERCSMHKRDEHEPSIFC